MVRFERILVSEDLRAQIPDSEFSLRWVLVSYIGPWISIRENIVAGRPRDRSDVVGGLRTSAAVREWLTQKENVVNPNGEGSATPRMTRTVVTNSPARSSMSSPSYQSSPCVEGRISHWTA